MTGIIGLKGQQKKAYELLMRKGKTTGRELIFECGTNYPSCLIRDLRNKGIRIDTESIPNKNYELYVLREELKLF